MKLQKEAEDAALPQQPDVQQSMVRLATYNNNPLQNDPNALSGFSDMTISDVNAPDGSLSFSGDHAKRLLPPCPPSALSSPVIPPYSCPVRNEQVSADCQTDPEDTCCSCRCCCFGVVVRWLNAK